MRRDSYLDADVSHENVTSRHHKNTSQVYDITGTPLELSHIHMSNTKHMSMIANRIDTEVEEGQIYLKHFFRASEKGKQQVNSSKAHNGKRMLLSRDKAGMRSICKNLNDTFYCQDASNWNAYDDSRVRDEESAYSSVYRMR